MELRREVKGSLTANAYCNHWYLHQSEYNQFWFHICILLNDQWSCRNWFENRFSYYFFWQTVQFPISKYEKGINQNRVNTLRIICENHHKSSYTSKMLIQTFQPCSDRIHLIKCVAEYLTECQLGMKTQSQQ